MAGFRILGTNHTSFTVSDLDRTLAFFGEGLGFAVTSRAPRSKDAIETITGVDGAAVMIAYVQGPGHRLEFIEYRGPADRERVKPRPCDVGFAHVAYDVDDIDAAIAMAARYDVHPINPPFVVDDGPNRGGKAAYLRDPDGITVEFIQPPPR